MVVATELGSERISNERERKSQSFRSLDASPFSFRNTYFAAIRASTFRGIESQRFPPSFFCLSCPAIAFCEGGPNVSSLCLTGRGQSPLGGYQHLFETRVIADAIEIRIDFGVINQACTHPFKGRTEHLQGSILVFEIIGQCTYNVIAHR